MISCIIRNFEEQTDAHIMKSIEETVTEQNVRVSLSVLLCWQQNTRLGNNICIIIYRRALPFVKL
jgi:hypothetical protein